MSDHRVTYHGPLPEREWIPCHVRFPAHGTDRLACTIERADGKRWVDDDFTFLIVSDGDNHTWKMFSNAYHKYYDNADTAYPWPKVVAWMQMPPLPEPWSDKL